MTCTLRRPLTALRDNEEMAGHLHKFIRAEQCIVRACQEYTREKKIETYEDLENRILKQYYMNTTFMGTHTTKNKFKLSRVTPIFSPNKTVKFTTKPYQRTEHRPNLSFCPYATFIHFRRRALKTASNLRKSKHLSGKKHTFSSHVPKPEQKFEPNQRIVPNTHVMVTNSLRLHIERSRNRSSIGVARSQLSKSILEPNMKDKMQTIGKDLKRPSDIVLNFKVVPINGLGGGNMLLQGTQVVVHNDVIKLRSRQQERNVHIFKLNKSFL